MPTGSPIILTADRTLTARYDLLFDGMLASSQTTVTPSPILTRLLAPQAPTDDGSARFAPLGLRRIEAALVRDGIPATDVTVVDEGHLAAAVGPATRVVAVSAGEPCGLGMSSTTMTDVLGGSIYPRVMLRRLLRRARALLTARAPEAKLVLGGPGAWQLASHPQARANLGINHVVTGYAEAKAPAVFRSLLAREEVPAVIEGIGPDADAIPPILGATTMGVVEISRGCGLGCSFCTIAREPMQHLPTETILADARTNLRAGLTTIAVLSEDLFRYGGDAGGVEPSALIGLLERLRALEGLGLIQTDHANIMSIARYSDDELSRVRGLLVGDSGCELPWVNVGVETASGELLARAGGGAKMAGAAPGDWGQHCATQVRRLIAAGWLPMVSLMIGLPGESEEHLRATLDWVHDLRRERVTIFPVLHAPVDGARPVTRSDLGHLHWRLIRECYALSFRWVPRMYWDNQCAVGVPLNKRLTLQVLGRAQVLIWRTAMALRQGVARP